MKKLHVGIITLVLVSSPALAKEPNCYGVDRWAEGIAYGALKNEGLIDPEKIDFSKTKTSKLASEKIGKDKFYHDDLYRQVQNIKYTEKSGSIIEVITISDATKTECSMGDVEVYVVSKHLN